MSDLPTPKTAGLPPRRIELQLESDPAGIAPVRRAIEDFAAEAGFADPIPANLGLSVNEALANVIRHAYKGVPGKPIVLTAEFPVPFSRNSHDKPAPSLRVTIRDWGNGFDPATLPPKPYDPLEPGGVGLICLQTLLDRTTYTPQPDGMLATLWKVR